MIASAKNTNTTNSTTVSNLQLDTTQYFTAQETYNLVLNNETIKDEIASAIYYKDIGSRKGLTIDASNVEYENSADSVKTVYTNKAITDIRKLVTEGYVKIQRQSLDVEIATEKAEL